jgi:hypothetical protein
VSYYKQYEFEIKKALDTPIKLIQIFRELKINDKNIPELEGLLNKDISVFDFEKLLKFENLILGDSKN